MRKRWCVVALTTGAAALPTASAIAASQTVQGTGDIEKMVANNAQSALKVTLFGLGAPCDAKYMKVPAEAEFRALDVLPPSALDRSAR